MRENIYDVVLTPEAIVKMLRILKDEGKIAKDSLDDSQFLVNSTPISMYVDHDHNVLHITMQTKITGLSPTGECIAAPQRGPIYTSKTIKDNTLSKVTTWTNVTKAKTVVQRLLGK